MPRAQKILNRLSICVLGCSQSWACLLLLMHLNSWVSGLHWHESSLFPFIPSCKMPMEGDARLEESGRRQSLFSEDIKPAPIRQIHLTSLYSILAAVINSRSKRNCIITSAPTRVWWGNKKQQTSFSGVFNLKIIFSETNIAAFLHFICIHANSVWFSKLNSAFHLQVTALNKERSTSQFALHKWEAGQVPCLEKRDEWGRLWGLRKSSPER